MSLTNNQGRVAVVTGASSGIGEATARPCRPRHLAISEVLLRPAGQL